MKHVKMLGLLAIAAAALMAFVGTASATLTEEVGDPVDVGDVFKATATHAQWTGTISVTCTHSLVEGTVDSNTANHAEGTITKLSFSGCGNNTATTINEGKGAKFTITESGSHGTVFLSNTEVTVLTHSLFLGTRHCIYVTNNTHVGTLTPGTQATVHIGAATNQSPTDSLCGNDAVWDVTYRITQPHTLLID